MVRANHLGRVSEAWQWLRSELKERAIPVAQGPSREVYFVASIDDAQDAREYVTELQVPIVPAQVRRKCVENTDDSIVVPGDINVSNFHYWDHEHEPAEEDIRCVLPQP